MHYFHEYIFMPRFDFNEYFWKNIKHLFLSRHARKRSQTREFPLLSLEELRSRGHIYEVGFDEKSGIAHVSIYIPMGDGRDLHYVISRNGLIITGWFSSSSNYHFPAKKKIYVNRTKIA